MQCRLAGIDREWNGQVSCGGQLLAVEESGDCTEAVVMVTWIEDRRADH